MKERIRLEGRLRNGQPAGLDLTAGGIGDAYFWKGGGVVRKGLLEPQLLKNSRPRRGQRAASARDKKNAGPEKKPSV